MMLKLTDMCLDKVCENLDVYILAFQTSEDEALRRMIELLRRLYSFAILDKMYHSTEKFKVKTLLEVKTVLPNHLHFLINRHIKELDVGLLKGYEWNIIVKKFAEIGSGLETVVFRDFNPWEEIICQLPNVREIEVERCQNNFLKHISEYCPKLKSLKMTHYDEFKGLSLPEIGLEKCSELRIVSLFFSKGPSLSLFIYLLQNLPDLEELDFEGMAEVFQIIRKDGMINLGSVTPYNLTVLELSAFGGDTIIVNDALRICARLCPRLKSLSTFVQNQEHLICVSKFAELQCLYVRKMGDSPVDLDKFLKENGRKFLVLEITEISLSIDNLLRSCLNLTKLTLNEITFLNVSDDYMPALFNLKYLELESFELDKLLPFQAISSILSRVPNLEKLKFNYCENFLSKMKACVLKRCNQGTIKHLSFFHSSIDFAFAKDVLYACTTLESFTYDEQLDPNDDEHSDELLKHLVIQLKAIALLLSNKPDIICENLF